MSLMEKGACVCKEGCIMLSSLPLFLSSSSSSCFHISFFAFRFLLFAFLGKSVELLLKASKGTELLPKDERFPEGTELQLKF